MKNTFRTLVMAAFLLISTAASAQLSYGVQGGLNLTNPKNFNSKTGWFIGPELQFNIPVIGLGINGSILYSKADIEASNIEANNSTIKQEYIDIPVNLRYSLGFSALAAVFVQAGPQFSWDISGNSIAGAYETVKGDDFKTSLNIGAGAKFLNHLEVYGGYNWALGNSFKLSDAAGKIVNGKNNMWKLSVAYLF